MMFLLHQKSETLISSHKNHQNYAFLPNSLNSVALDFSRDFFMLFRTHSVCESCAGEVQNVSKHQGDHFYSKNFRKRM